MKPDADSLIKLKGGKTVMACVSLKALEGRVGKVTTLFIVSTKFLYILIDL